MGIIAIDKEQRFINFGFVGVEEEELKRIIKIHKRYLAANDARAANLGKLCSLVSSWECRVVAHYKYFGLMMPSGRQNHSVGLKESNPAQIEENVKKVKEFNLLRSAVNKEVGLQIKNPFVYGEKVIKEGIEWSELEAENKFGLQKSYAVFMTELGGYMDKNYNDWNPAPAPISRAILFETKNAALILAKRRFGTKFSLVELEVRACKIIKEDESASSDGLRAAIGRAEKETLNELIRSSNEERLKERVAYLEGEAGKIKNADEQAGGNELNEMVKMKENKKTRL